MTKKKYKDILVELHEYLKEIKELIEAGHIIFAQEKCEQAKQLIKEKLAEE